MHRHHFFAIVMFLLWGIGAYAQQDKAVRERVAEIRQMYAQAKDNANREPIPDVPKSEVTVNASYMAPGAGPRNDVVHYFFTNDYDENLSTYVCMPYLITRSYNVAARKFYQEYLFDGDGNLVFAYLHNDGFSEDAKDEARYYWRKVPKKLVHKAVKGSPEMDEVLAARRATELVDAFNCLMNSDY